MSEPQWLESDAVAQFCRLAVAETGELYAIRDAGLLEAAVAAPRNCWSYGEEDVVELAVRLLFAIARNHPFIQGNKRAAFLSALEFLEINGYEWEGPDHAAVAEIFCSVIEGDVSDGQFVSMFASWVRPLGASDMDMSPK